MFAFLFLAASALCVNSHFCHAFIQSNSDVAQYFPQEHSEQLTDWIQDKPFSQVEYKRTPPSSLSIVNPLDVLRQKLMLDMTRRRMRQTKGQVAANREWLKSIGKRSDVNYD